MNSEGVSAAVNYVDHIAIIRVIDDIIVPMNTLTSMSVHAVTVTVTDVLATDGMMVIDHYVGVTATCGA